MASYYDTYEVRPRQSARDDAYPPRSSRDGTSYLNPAAGRTSRSQRPISDERPAPTTNYRYERYPPPLSPTTARPKPPRSPNRRRAAWPPSPSCEEERLSLAKEAGSQILLSTLRKDEAISRGSIDQEPLLQYTPEFVHYEASKSVRHGSQAPTQTSRRDKTSQNPPPVVEQVPELARRKASPYAYTKPTSSPKKEARGDRYLSPDTSILGERSGSYANLGSASAPTSPNRTSAKTGDGYFPSKYRPDENAVEDTDCDTSDSASSRRKGPRSPRSSHSTVKPSARDFTAAATAATASSLGIPTRKKHLDARRNTDTSDSMPSVNRKQFDSGRRPTPLVAATALSDLNDPLEYTSSPTSLKPDDLQLPPRSREASYSSSRGVSPSSKARTQTTPAQGSKQNFGSPRGTPPGSSPASRNSSLPNSRPASPSPQTLGETNRLSKTEYDWNAFLVDGPRRSRPPSRLATNARQESMPQMPSMPQTDYIPPTLSFQTERPASFGALPYPEDDGPGTPSIVMPAEDRYFVPTPNLSAPFNYEPVSSSRNDTVASASTRPPPPARPPFHHSNTGSLVPEGRQRTIDTRHASISNSETRKELLALLKRGLPDCPRPAPISGYDDWYTAIGAPNLEFCPDCVRSVFDRTVFRPSIRRSPPRNLNSKVQCAFGSSAWTRFGWMLTLRQLKVDLSILKDLSDIEEATEPCPGFREAHRSWYGLRDDDGLFVRDFYVCYNDVRKIERLFPTLSGVFVRLPQRPAHDKQLCATRADGNRFSSYLDKLVTAHETALSTRKPVDPMPFIELIERKTRLRECSRDNMLIGGLWHTIPSLPDLTVCEDCYDTIVEPEVRQQMPLALRFARTVQPAYGEGMGSSCQLYSPRMRRVFARAIEANDFKYLARKAEERREAELRLQERYKDVLRRAKRLSREGSGGEEDERRLNRELERITGEWQAKWE